MKQNLKEMMEDMAKIKELIETSYGKARAKAAKEEMYGGDAKHWMELAKEILNALEVTEDENADLRDEMAERREEMEAMRKEIELLEKCMLPAEVEEIMTDWTR